MYDPSCIENLVDLITRVRCMSNAPSVGVIDWPGFVRTNVTAVAAWRARATLIEVPHGPNFYSTDRVHPNALGPRAHRRARAGLLVAPAAGSRVRVQLRLPGHPWGGVLPERKRTCRWCARPLARPRGWRLVDDSPPPHLVHKYGWASRDPGANLTLSIPPSETCGAIVRLAYLASNFTGPFRVTCEAGCVCSRIRFFHQWRAFPFPVVTGHEDCIVGTMQGDCRAMKITRDTSFNLLRKRAAPCRVTVTPLTRLRVRLDGLYVEQPSGDYLSRTRGSRRRPRPSSGSLGQTRSKTDCAS